MSTSSDETQENADKVVGDRCNLTVAATDAETALVFDSSECDTFFIVCLFAPSRGEDVFLPSSVAIVGLAYPFPSLLFACLEGVGDPERAEDFFGKILGDSP